MENETQTERMDRKCHRGEGERAFFGHAIHKFTPGLSKVTQQSVFFFNQFRNLFCQVTSKYRVSFLTWLHLTKLGQSLNMLD